ncbi:transposase [Klebsiella pneumoniae]|uniref:transposase n=1 Tax=Klebsiella pneumoniae TaxID=573 RepID=UPI003F586F41
MKSLTAVRKKSPNYPVEFKIKMVELSHRPEISVAQLAREHGINDNLLFKWRQYWGSRDFPSKNDKVLWRPRRPWPPEGYYFSLTGKYPSIERISSSRSGNFSLNSKW